MVQCVVDRQIFLLQNGHLRVQNFHELGLLLLQEVDLGVLAQLKRVYETRMLHEATTVEGLDLERGGQSQPLFLLFLPIAVHVAEDDSSHVSSLHFLG